MKLKIIPRLFVLLFFLLSTVEVHATDKGLTSIKKDSVVTIDSADRQILCFQSSDSQSLDSPSCQNCVSEQHNLHENILFWVTIITSVVSVIMLFVAISQLRKQRESSKKNSDSTNVLLNNLNTLIDNQNKDTEKAREDRMKVLGGLKSGVCKINAQIFNNVLTDIAIKKQEIRTNCNDICFYFKRNPHVLKEDFAILDPKVLDLVNQIENSIATLKEMFGCYGCYNDDCKNTFAKLIEMIERLREEPGIAPTKKQRDAYLYDITFAENELMQAVNTAIDEMRNLIDENNEQNS